VNQETLLRFRTAHRDAGSHVSVVTNGSIVDLCVSAMELPREMTAPLTAGQPLLQRAKPHQGNDDTIGGAGRK
jgi:hypothetical protein